MKNISLSVMLLMCLGLQLVGCGSGTPDQSQQKTVAITFSAISTATLPTAINGIKISAILPVGVTATLQPGTTNQLANLTTPIATGSIFGSYSASSRQITVTVADFSQPSTGLGSGNIGDFAKLVCTFSPGLALTDNSFLSINPTFPDFKVTGYITSSSGATSLDLTGKLRPSLRVTF